MDGAGPSLVVRAVVALPCLALAALGVWLVLRGGRTLARRRRLVGATGVVVDHVVHRFDRTRNMGTGGSTRPRYSVTPVVDWGDPCGRVRRGRPRDLVNPTSPPVGEAIRVLYDPRDPGWWTLPGVSSSWFPVVLGGALVVVGLVATRIVVVFP